MRPSRIFLLRQCITPLYIRGMRKNQYTETLPPARITKRARRWVRKEAIRACGGNECALLRELIESEMLRQRHSDKKRSM